jgi:hypothetical protein
MDIAYLCHSRTLRTYNPHPPIPVTQTSHIGEPILFSSGQFMGRTVRFELHELQKAKSGRKKVFSISKIPHLTFSMQVRQG